MEQGEGRIFTGQCPYFLGTPACTSDIATKFCVIKVDDKNFFTGSTMPTAQATFFVTQMLICSSLPPCTTSTSLKLTHVGV